MHGYKWPIVQGYMLSTAEHRSFAGGLSVTAELRRLLMDSAVDVALLEGRGAADSVRRLKEAHGYVVSAAEARSGSGGISRQQQQQQHEGGGSSQVYRYTGACGYNRPCAHQICR